MPKPISAAKDRVLRDFTAELWAVLFMILCPPGVGRGLACHPVSVMILTRLTVTTKHQGRGLGQTLLKDALLRTVQAADIVGIRVLLVHAKDEKTRRWYASRDFELSPTDLHHMFLLLKDLKVRVLE
ncbi:MAG: hypothetical protein ACLFQG_03420 [Desulfovermiculus sp.]